MNVFLYSNKIKLLIGDSNVWKDGIKTNKQKSVLMNKHLQGSNKDSDIKNGFVDRDGEGEGGMNWDNSTDIHFHM